MRIKDENATLRSERTALADDLAKANRLVNRLRLELDRTNATAAKVASDAASSATAAMGSTAPPPLPFDINEEARLEAALGAERAQRELLEAQLSSLVRNVREAAGLAGERAEGGEGADKAAAGAEAGEEASNRTGQLASTEAQARLVGQLRELRQRQARAAEEARVQLELTTKEKTLLQTRHDLGRRRRDKRADSGQLQAPTALPANGGRRTALAPTTPASIKATRTVDKENVRVVGL